MISSDFRTEARRSLAGKWGKAALITLVYVLIFYVIDLIIGHVPEKAAAVCSLLLYIIEIPLSFGLLISLYKLYKSEDVGYFSFISLGFDNFGKAWGITLHIALKCIVPIILIVISIMIIVGSAVYNSATAITVNDVISTNFSGGVILGFIILIISEIWLLVKAYYYALATIIAADDLAMPSKDAVNKSQELMTGKRGKLMILQLSFIGWALLSIFTFGIGYLFLAPYIQFATFEFFKNANGDTPISTNENNTNVEPIN